MNMANEKIPKNFVWGAASALYQIESDLHH